MNDRSGDNIVGDGLCAVPYYIIPCDVFFLFYSAHISTLVTPQSAPAGSSHKRGAKGVEQQLRQSEIFTAEHRPAAPVRNLCCEALPLLR